MGEARDPADADVDARFLLANERTLLAWVRTALTLLAGGVGVEGLARGLSGRTAIASVLVVAGAGAAATGAQRHAVADRALRSGALPRTGAAPYVLALGVAGLGAVLLLAMLLAR